MRESKILLSLLEDIIEKEDELETMSENWDSGDALSQACSDPGLQYELSSEIDEMWDEFAVIYKGVFDEQV